MRVCCVIASLSPFLLCSISGAFISPSQTFSPRAKLTTEPISAPSSATSLDAAVYAAALKSSPRKKYEPKWKKKQTLGEQLPDGAPPAFDQVGLKGDVSVVFRQGNTTRTTMALRGQPIRDVASQAGQFIKYGCGKGECGTCEALVHGKWVRPCTALVPADASLNEPYVIVVKEVKSKSASSGKFFSVRSFLMGFWNNLLGMVGFVKSRRDARRSWNERKEYEDLIKLKALEKKRSRQEQQHNPKP